MKVALFVPCFVDAFFPEVGIATLQLLERLGCEVDYPLDQTCCGQPMANCGLQRRCGRLPRRCSCGIPGLRLRRHALRQLHAPRPCPFRRDRADRRGDEVRARTYELVEFLHDVLKVRGVPLGRVPAQGRPAQRLRRPARAAACLDVGARASRSSPSRMDLLSKVAGIELVTPQRPDECCGFGGTFSVFEEPVSAKMGYDKVSDHSARRCRVHRLGRHLVPDAPEGLRRAARGAE